MICSWTFPRENPPKCTTDGLASNNVFLPSLENTPLSPGAGTTKACGSATNPGLRFPANMPGPIAPSASMAIAMEQEARRRGGHSAGHENADEGAQRNFRPTRVLGCSSVRLAVVYATPFLARLPAAAQFSSTIRSIRRICCRSFAGISPTSLRCRDTSLPSIQTRAFHPFRTTGCPSDVALQVPLYCIDRGPLKRGWCTGCMRAGSQCSTFLGDLPALKAHHHARISAKEGHIHVFSRPVHCILLWS